MWTHFLVSDNQVIWYSKRKGDLLRTIFERRTRTIFECRTNFMNPVFINHDFRCPDLQCRPAPNVGRERTTVAVAEGRWCTTLMALIRDVCRHPVLRLASGAPKNIQYSHEFATTGNTIHDFSIRIQWRKSTDFKKTFILKAFNSFKGHSNRGGAIHPYLANDFIDRGVEECQDKLCHGQAATNSSRIPFTQKVADFCEII